MLAMPVRPVSSVMTPVPVMVMMPVRIVPVVFLYYHGFSFTGRSSSDDNSDNPRAKNNVFMKIYRRP
jgi:hypothetical protein